MKDCGERALLGRRRFLALAAHSLLLAGCGTTGPGATIAPTPTVVQATDGRSRITLPTGWDVQENLNDKAELQVGDRKRQAFLIVLTEVKQDFAPDVTYRDHARMTLATLQGRVEAVKQLGEVADLRINGKPAVQHEFTAIAGKNRLNIHYIHTTVDGARVFHQLLAWTTFSRMSEERDRFAAAIGSFEDLS